MKVPFAFVFFLAALMGQAPNDALSISGKWHLVPSSSDEIRLPDHRVDLVFRGEENGLSGAVINRVTGEDIPLRSLRLSGNVLMLEIGGGATLTMIRKGERFEGHWMKGATEIGPALQLVRFR